MLIGSQTQLSRKHRDTLPSNLPTVAPRDPQLALHQSERLSREQGAVKAITASGEGSCKARQERSVDEEREKGYVHGAQMTSPMGHCAVGHDGCFGDDDDLV